MYSGEDKDLTITVLNEDGTPLDLSAATGIIVGVYEKPQRLINQYSLIADDDYDSLTVSGGDNNQIVIAIDAAYTQKVNDKLIYIAGKAIIAGKNVMFKADAEIIDSHPLSLVTVPE